MGKDLTNNSKLTMKDLFGSVEEESFDAGYKGYSNDYSSFNAAPTPAPAENNFNEFNSFNNSVVEPTPVAPAPVAAPTAMPAGPSGSGSTTIIGESCRINGSIATPDDLELYGFIAGNVDTDSDIYLYGKVAGDIHCRNYYQYTGAVKGDIYAEDFIRIEKDGAVLGNMSANAIVSDGKTAGDMNGVKTTELLGNAVVKGDITTGYFSMKDTVALKGIVKLTSTETELDSAFEGLFDNL